MAQFLKAKFLSEALKWKADPRHANDQFFAGLRYDPYIFAQARMVFPEYNKRFPHPANKEFTENFARDLNNPTRNKEILKIINPEVITWELVAANQQFEAESHLEQQQISQATGQPPPQPFSLAAPTSRTPRIIVTTEVPPAKQPAETPAKTSSAPLQPKVSGPSFRAPRIPASFANTLRNIGSGAGIFFKKNVGKYITAGRVATAVSAGIGAITGGALTQGSTIGMLGGGGLGAIAPSWIRSGEGTRFLGKVGNGAINFGANLSNQVSSGATRLSMSSGSKKWALGLLGAFLLFFVFSAIGNLTGTTPPSQAGPLPPPPGGGGDIINCKFTRGGDSVKELTYKSPLLLGYTQEASALTSIPSVVLAAFIRVETPSTVTKNDDEIRNLSSVANCPRSTTGALGVMQLQPQGTKGHDAGAIANGARLIGKQYDELTEEDYCDVRKNVIMGSGFILKKMSYVGYGDGTKWDPVWTNNRPAIEALVTGYYGCLNYGGAKDCTGPYNYADDVSISIQNCKPQPSAPPPGGLASCPLAGSRTITCGSYGSDPMYNASFCNGPQPEDRGHCGRTYNYPRYRCSPDSRRAHAIDVKAEPGETVYLPTIEGKKVTWSHILQGPVGGLDGGGYWHYFGAILGSDQWFLYLIHVDEYLFGFSGGKSFYESGDPITTIAATDFPHVHVNIGKNPPKADSGPGWLNPEDIGMCTQ